MNANGSPIALESVDAVSPVAFHDACSAALAAGHRLIALPAFERAPALDVIAIFADDAHSELSFARTSLRSGESYPALSRNTPSAQAFERELFESYGIVPGGHPWLKPLREAHRDGRDHAFFRVSGHGIHEVAVGPVHAGVIEPGHFRFQCAGEEVLHLEIHLGYQRRGAEALFLRSTPARRLVVAESIAGDTAVGHAIAHVQAVEALSWVEPPLRAQAIRGIALELERIANHVGDLGALCNDVGFLPGAAWFGRIRGDFLNMLLAISGNRFGRGLVIPGGVRFDIAPEERDTLVAKLAEAERDLRATARVVFDAPSVSARFEQTGIVERATALEIGLVGPVARASGIDRDARRDHPSGVFRFALIPVALGETGDVMARAVVRWIEVQRSLTFVREQLAELATGPVRTDVSRAAPDSLVVSMVEGWRGEIVHVALSGSDGELRGYKVVDPSFHNWFGLAMALRGNQISDFPLCNKSFNLSYSGHDL